VRVFLANVTAEPHPVRLEGISGPLFRSALGASSVEATGPELELAPQEVARVDVLPAGA
jgi:hypothetical protein